MRRKSFLKMLGASAAVCGTGTLGSRAPGAAEGRGKRPCNVLIVHTDEHNFRTLGCYRRALPRDQALMWGEPVVETPHIDSIADRGLVADAHYCASPICSPSRASFITGLYPMGTTVITNDIRITQDLETFATALAREGYATGYAGKWHLDGSNEGLTRAQKKVVFLDKEAGVVDPHWVPAERGMGFTDNRYMFDVGHNKKFDIGPNGEPRAFVHRQIGDEKTFTTDWLTDRTLEFIDAHHDEPFCYMVSFPDPHGPDKVREPYYGMYKDAPFETPRTAGKDPKSAPKWGAYRDPHERADDAAYFGMVKCIDDNVGRLLERLGKHGLTDRTIVVFTADHGDLRGEHGRQNKGVPYEGSSRIPFVIAAPGLIPAGSRAGLALNTVDFKPTLLGLLGVKAEQPSHGRDASPILRGQGAPEGWTDLVFSRSPAVRKGVAWLMVVGGGYKLIANASEPVWLIDLKNDPDELTNIAGKPEMKPIVQRMARALLDYAVKYEDPNLPVGNLRASLEEAALPDSQ